MVIRFFYPTFATHNQAWQDTSGQEMSWVLSVGMALSSLDLPPRAPPQGQWPSVRRYEGWQLRGS